MSTVTLAITDAQYDQFSLSYQTILQVIHWRNETEGSICILFARTAAEFAFLGLAIIAIIESVARFFFSIIAIIYGDYDTATNHLKGSLISTITLILAPAHLISNLFNTRMSDEIL